MQTRRSAAAHLILLHLHFCVHVRHIPDSDTASSSSTVLSSLDLKSRNWRNFNNLDTFCYKGGIKKQRLYDTHFSNLVDLYIFFRTISALNSQVFFYFTLPCLSSLEIKCLRPKWPLTLEGPPPRRPGGADQCTNHKITTATIDEMYTLRKVRIEVNVGQLLLTHGRGLDRMKIIIIKKNKTEEKVPLFFMNVTEVTEQQTYHSDELRVHNILHQRCRLVQRSASVSHCKPDTHTHTRTINWLIRQNKVSFRPLFLVLVYL